MNSQSVAESPTIRLDSEKSSDGRSKRGLPWFKWHAWLGYKLSILMFVICLTGTIATVSDELDWLVNPMLRVEAVDTPYQWQAMYQNFQERYPGSSLTYIDAPRYANYAAVGLMTTAEGVTRRVFFNQYTGEVTGDLPWAASVQRFLRDLHRFLLFPISLGAYMVSFFGFILLASVVTALFVYKKWWRGFFKLRLDKGKRILYGDLHRLLGVWSLWFLFIIALTSVWYFVERAARDSGYWFVEPVNAVRLAAPENYSSSDFITLDEAVAAAKTAIPELRVRYLNVPRQLGDRISPYLIAGQATAILVRANANQVWVDPFTGDVLQYHRADDSPIGRRIIESMDPLHFGNFAGLTSKLVYLFFGLATLAMSVTGGWMWLRRNHSLQQRGLNFSFMGWWKHTSLFIVMIGLSWGLYKIFTFGNLFA